MKRALVLILPALVLLIGGIACERLNPSGDDQTDTFATLADIPADYGELQAVTIMPEHPGWFQLWFEDNTGTIRQVRIQPVQKLIHKTVQVIPRSGPAVPEQEE